MPVQAEARAAWKQSSAWNASNELLETGIDLLEAASSPRSGRVWHACPAEQPALPNHVQMTDGPEPEPVSSADLGNTLETMVMHREINMHTDLHFQLPLKHRLLSIS